METDNETTKQPENTLQEQSPLIQPCEPSTTITDKDEAIEIEPLNLSSDNQQQDVKQADDINEVPAEKLSDNHDDVGEDFVMVDGKNLEFESHRAAFFSQMETFLLQQIARCQYYKETFEKQSNVTMANKFATYSLSSTKHLELLQLCWRNNEPLPKFKFENVCFNCLPVNIDVKDKELQLIIKTSNMKVSPGASIYSIAEFEFPHPRDEPMTNYMARWIHYAKIDHKKLFCCSGEESRQLDIVHSIDIAQIFDPENKFTSFNRALTFFVDKGKSRTLKRKFKPIKLIFYEKTSIFKCDNRLGSALVRIDAINDESSLLARIPITNGRKQTDAFVEVRIKVREPLVNKSIRSHEEKMMLLI